MTNNVSVELKESRSHAFLDVAVTIMGETRTLSQSFTHASRDQANKIVSELQLAAEKIIITATHNALIIQTNTDIANTDTFSIKGDKDAFENIFEHVKSLTNLQGFKLV